MMMVVATWRPNYVNITQEWSIMKPVYYAWARFLGPFFSQTCILSEQRWNDWAFELEKISKVYTQRKKKALWDLLYACLHEIHKSKHNCPVLESFLNIFYCTLHTCIKHYWPCVFNFEIMRAGIFFTPGHLTIQTKEQSAFMQITRNANIGIFFYSLSSV